MYLKREQLSKETQQCLNQYQKIIEESRAVRVARKIKPEDWAKSVDNLEALKKENKSPIGHYLDTPTEKNPYPKVCE